MLLVFRKNAAGLAARGAVAGVLPWGTPAGVVSREPAGPGLICGAAMGAGLCVSGWVCSPAFAALCRHARLVKKCRHSLCLAQPVGYYCRTHHCSGHVDHICIHYM